VCPLETNVARQRPVKPGLRSFPKPLLKWRYPLEELMFENPPMPPLSSGGVWLAQV